MCSLWETQQEKGKPQVHMDLLSKPTKGLLKTRVNKCQNTERAQRLLLSVNETKSESRK